MDLNLFELQISEDKLHPNFQVISKDPELVRVIERWAKGFVDRDNNKFVKEFQKTFNSSFWEIYIYACLDKLNFKFDFSHTSPDFHISKNGLDYVVEAVSTGNPEGFISEHEKSILFQQDSQKHWFQSDHEQMHADIISLATERIRKSFTDKYKKYLNSYQKLPHVKNKPFILAIGAFEQPYFFTQKSAAISRVLYGIKDARYGSFGEPLISIGETTLKHNESEIDIGMFNDRKYEHVSAVLFNPIATSGKARAHQRKKSKEILFDTVRYNLYGSDTIREHSIPHNKYHESLLDGMYLLINPYAKYPIDPNLFDDNDISIWYDAKEQKVKHRFLFTRSVLNITRYGDGQEEDF
ncbi:hypothetical protein [Paenibacillus xylanexedens]|uniref:hypothetical protein n=1 Tax=Paenibacillus xylanexedens TaxID=528191 RepID=UPI003B01B096